MRVVESLSISELVLSPRFQYEYVETTHLNNKESVAKCKNSNSYTFETIEKSLSLHLGNVYECIAPLSCVWCKS